MISKETFSEYNGEHTNGKLIPRRPKALDFGFQSLPLYWPEFRAFQKVRVSWWRRLDSNQRPTDYETVALAT